MKSAALGLMVSWLALYAVACGAFPDRPLTLIVPFSAAGSTDIAGSLRITKLVKMMQTLSTPSLTDSLAQQVAHALTGTLGTTVNVARRAGERSLAGTRLTANAAPDGHTLLFADNPAFTIFPALKPQFSYNPYPALTPVAVIARIPIAVITSTDNPAHTVRHMGDRVRLAAGRVNYASAGDGTTSHLAAELFRSRAGISMVHVNFNGSVDAINAVVTRNVDFGFVPLTAVLPYLNGGRVRIIALTSAARHPALPDVPALADAGLPGYAAEGWFGVFAPARTPVTVVARLNLEINRAFSDDAAQRMLISQGLAPAPGTPQEFQMRIEKDSDQWSRLLKTMPEFLKAS